jgi:hypothetical protein
MFCFITNSVYIALHHGYRVIDKIHESIRDSIDRKQLVKEFRLDELPQLTAKFDKLLNLLVPTPTPFFR